MPSSHPAHTSRRVDDHVSDQVQNEIYRYLHSSDRALNILDDITVSQDSAGDIEILWGPSGNNLCWDNKIYVDKDESNPRKTAVAVGHEVTHLLAVSGTTGDWRTMTRDEYVQVMTDEEINAHAAAYVIHMQAILAGIDYRGIEPVAYADFENWRMTIPAEQQGTWDEIEELAKDWVEDQYRSGAWVTGTTRQNYYDHFAERYDSLWRGEAVDSGNVHSYPVTWTVAEATRSSMLQRSRNTVLPSPQQSGGSRIHRESSTISRGGVPSPKGRRR